MSDVIATILLLGITVSLFSTIFVFVNRFPHPPAQSTDQFQTTLVPLVDCNGLTSPGVAVHVTLLSGPSVSGFGRVYLRQIPLSGANWQYTATNGVPVPWGFPSPHNNTAIPWTAGQTWCTYLNKALGTANLTVSILSSSVLLYENTIPGSPNNVPQVITRTWTVQPQPQVKANFTIYASFATNLTANATVRISLAGIPGLTSTLQNMAFTAPTTLASYQVKSGLTTTPGTFLAFINGTQWVGTVKQSFSATVLVTLVGQSGCGAGISISVTPSPNPPLLRTFQSPVATVANSGSSTVNITALTFYANYTSNNTALWNSSASSVSGVPVGGSVKFTPSKAWMPGPRVGSSQVTLRVVASFCSAPVRSASGSQMVTFSPPPFSVSIGAVPTVLPGGPASTYRLTFSVSNYGPLNGSTIVGFNATVKNVSGGTASGTASCNAGTSPYSSCFYNPPTYSGTPVVTGNAVAAGPLSLSAGSTATGVLYVVGPGGTDGGAPHIVTILVTLTITNPAWTAAGFTTAAYTFPTTLTFQV